jgi:1-acyl-sn-glycerol-3-phosphate acyltransferase
MAKEELFKNRILDRAFRALGAFPIRRGTVDRRSLSHALGLLNSGQIIGLFPEGTRIKTGKLGNFFHGPAFLALKSNKPVLPVVIKWPGKIFRPVRIKVGPLIYFHGEGKIGKKILENASSKIFEEMTRLWSGL